MDKSVPFILTLGDNYYPDTKRDPDTNKKLKVFDKLSVQSMYECLHNTADIPKIMIMGNHDFKPEKSYVGFEDPCSSINTQLSLIDNDEFVANKLFYVNEDVPDTLFIFMNTNLYDDDEDDLIEYGECMNELYSKLFGISLPKEILSIEDKVIRRRETIEFYREFQETQIKDFCKSSLGIENIFFCGHHPMYGVKTKEKDGKFLLKKQQMNLNGLLFIQDIIDIFYPENSQIKLYYLCADVHLYQKSFIYFDKYPYLPIEQIIVGTGGAKLDKEPLKYADEPFQDKYNIMTTQIIESHSNHGFLLTKRIGPSYISEFISV